MKKLMWYNTLQEKELRKARFSICPEGAAAIGITAFSAIFFAIMGWKGSAFVFWVLFLFSMHFFRDPDRVRPQGKDVACSPADGTVVSIESRDNPFGGAPLQCISIFMSIFNVHVNRAPVDCQVKEIRYFSGLFLNASLDKASKDNERCAWLLQDKNGQEWVMVQIAGLIARRIVCRAEPGDNLAMGQRLGMIRFGSRVDLYLPAGYVPAISKGVKVYGGETVIARKA